MEKLSVSVSKVEESTTLAITSLIKRLKCEGKDVLSFSAGEPDFHTPQFIKNAAIEAINKNFTNYTANEGTPELINAILSKFKSENGLIYEPANILVSNGAKHSLYNVLMAICNQGDEVIFQAPYWVSYPEMTKLAGAIPVVIQAGVEQNYKISPKLLKASITKNTKAIILNSPSNPTGAVYTESEIRALADVINDTEIYLISDEIYEKIIFDGVKHFSPASIDYLFDRTITVNGVSKAFSMTGWRIGYMAGPKDLIKLARNIQSHSTSNTCSISQMATIAALKGDVFGNPDNPFIEIESMKEQFLIRRNYICEEIAKISGLKMPVPGGAFYAFFDVSHYFGKKFNGAIIENSTSFCKFLLEEEMVGLVPGSAFGDDRCVRMSYACSQKNIAEGLRRLQNGLKKLQ